MSKSTLLRGLLTSPDTLVMPDAYDPLSARIIEKLGFKAVQCSGYSFAIAACWSSEAEFGRDRNLALTAGIAGAVNIPVMADGEDGFGDVTAIPSTIRDFIKAGVAGINIEDQMLGNPAPKRLIDRDAAVEKIKTARTAAQEQGEPDLVINGRTDALAVAPDKAQGIAEAIVRANLYLEAGADLAFVTDVTTLDQVRLLVKEISGPVSIAAGLPSNINDFSVAQLRDCGVGRVSLPTVAVFSAIAGMTRCLESIRDCDGFSKLNAQDLLLCSPERLSSLMNR